jgi:hypothetical protein
MDVARRCVEGRLSQLWAVLCPSSPSATVPPHAREGQNTGTVGIAGGFEAVPEELRASRSSIATALEEAAAATWQRPSGDYGHAGVQSAFAWFIRDAERRVGELGATVDGLGRGLGESAAAYEDSDAAAARTLVAAVEDLGKQTARGARVAAGAASKPSEVFKRLTPNRAEGR